MVASARPLNDEFDLPAGEEYVEPRMKTREPTSHTRLAARARYRWKHGEAAQAFSGA